jgi:hypothetical protein
LTFSDNLQDFKSCLVCACTVMDQHLEHIIRQALEDAEARGKDYLTQTALAVGTVLGTHPYTTASDALAMVKMVRHSHQ